MSKLPIPEVPQSTGRTAHLVARLVQRRKALGLTQEDVANRFVEYAAKLAERFNEPPVFTSLSKNMISRWEKMFQEKPTKQHKTARLNMSMVNYAMWNRVLDMRMFVDFVPAGDPGKHVFLSPEAAHVARQLAGLPEEQRKLISDLVQQMWAAYREDHEQVMPLYPHNQKK